MGVGGARGFAEVVHCFGVEDCFGVGYVEEDFSDLLVGYFVVNYFLHSNAEAVTDGSVPEYVQFTDVALAQGPRFAAP